MAQLPFPCGILVESDRGTGAHLSAYRICAAATDAGVPSGIHEPSTRRSRGPHLATAREVCFYSTRSPT